MATEPSRDGQHAYHLATWDIHFQWSHVTKKMKQINSVDSIVQIENLLFFVEMQNTLNLLHKWIARKETQLVLIGDGLLTIR